MNNEILELAKECGLLPSAAHTEEIQAFYDRAFQAGRDSMQSEMSQQEPVAYCGAQSSLLSWGNSDPKCDVPLIAQPQSPQTNEGKTK